MFKTRIIHGKSENKLAIGRKADAKLKFSYNCAIQRQHKCQNNFIDQFIKPKTFHRDLLGLYDTAVTSFTYKTYKLYHSLTFVYHELISFSVISLYVTFKRPTSDIRKTSEASDMLSVVLKSFKIALFFRYSYIYKYLKYNERCIRQ